MEILKKVLTGSALHSDLKRAAKEDIAAFVSEATSSHAYSESVVATEGKILILGRDKQQLRLYVLGAEEALVPFSSLADGMCHIDIGGPACSLAFVPAGHDAARAVRNLLPWTSPTVQGLMCSVGLGDRVGLATPGHVKAVKGTKCRPYFAQQSIREMTRTQRTPAEVMDAATWGALQVGWRDGFGSDADHLKETADIDACAAVGFTMYTIDPGDHVRSEADTMDVSSLASMMSGVPWKELETTPDDLRDRYLGQTFMLDGGGEVDFDQASLARAIVKYGGAIAHTARMYRHLVSIMAGKPFELEVSVDETATPTTTAEHYLIAAELKRLGVRWVGLAPRFVGEFEKGIDYKGSLREFEASFAEHVAIARTLGPYKMSIHSGSDKFSIYPIMARLAGQWVHVKTAGTSYLEALRVAARKRPDLFRRIVEFAFSRFDTDRRTYHISARVESIPRPERLSDAQLEPELLDKNDGRQLLHVTFGSVLTARTADDASRFRAELLETLIEYEEEHCKVLGLHLGRHVQPFVE